MANLNDSYVYTFIESQIPEHIKNDYELYTAFLKAYYEWLCSEGHSLYAVDNLQSFLDIDTAPEYFYNMLKDEILAEFPSDVLADKRLLLRYAKDFYERKGTLSSYNFLFKVLYNDNVSISYPSENILKASDGKWVVDYTIYAKKVTGNPFDLVSTYIYTEDGTQLVTDNVVMSKSGRYDVYEITVEPIDLELAIGAKLFNEDKSVVVETYGIIKNIEVLDGGNGYSLGDLVPIIDNSGDGVNAVGIVKNINEDNKITGFSILDGGHNYRVGAQLQFIPVNGGSGAAAYVNEIDAETVSTQCVTTIETEQNVTLESVQTIRIADYVRYENFEIGSIKSVKLVSGGNGYKILPYIKVVQDQLFDLPEAYGADIKPLSSSTGRITEIDLINRGVGFTSEDYINVDLTRSGNGQAKAIAHIFGGVNKSDGYWKNNDGKLDSTMYLQDNVYYQNFSYVIKSSQPMKAYKNIVKSTVHPAGTQMYGEISVVEEVSVHGDNEMTADKQISVCIEKEVIASLEKLIKEIVVHIEHDLKAADIYDYEYYINDFKDEYIKNYRNLILHDFKAIRQDLLLYDNQYLTIEQLEDTPIDNLYGTFRRRPDSAYVAVVRHE